MNTRIRNNKKVVDQEFVCMVLTARLIGHVTLSALPAVSERNETLPYIYIYTSNSVCIYIYTSVHIYIYMGVSILLSGSS